MKTLYSIILISLISLSIFTITSCTKDAPQTPTQPVAPATHLLTGLLGNEEITIQGSPSYFTDISNQNTEDHDGGHNGEGQDPDDARSLLITGCKWHAADPQGIAIATTGSVELRKEVFRIYVTPFMSNQYYGMVTPGVYNFAYQHNSSTGAYITMRDKNGVLWTSKGDQTGSSFQIVSRGADKQMFTTVTGTVSCKMYDSNGNMKLFTSGAFTANCGL